MVDNILIIAAVISLLSIFIALIRFIKGPSVLDRVVAFDVISIIAISLIAIIAYIFRRIIYIDVALVYGLLSFLGVLGRGPLLRKGAVMEILGSVLVLIGSIIFFLSSLGVIRMPDVYNRIQTGTKATTLGTILVLAGIAVLSPGWIPKLVILLVFIILTNPVFFTRCGKGGSFQ